MRKKTLILQNALGRRFAELMLLTGLVLLASLTNHLQAGIVVNNGFIDLENTDYGSPVFSYNGPGPGQVNAVFVHVLASHNQTSFLATRSESNQSFYIDAFNGSTADPGNPDAVFTGSISNPKTRTITLADIPLTTNSKYRVLLLDVNQNKSLTNGDNHIDIKKLQVYVSSSGSYKALSELDTSPTAIEIYNMTSSYVQDTIDASIDKINTIRVDGDKGSGKADMYFFLDNNLFVNGFQSLGSPGNINNMNVYLRFGYNNPTDGSDEWTLSSDTFYDPTVVPEPAAMALWALGGSMGMIWSKRRKRAKSA